MDVHPFFIVRVSGGDFNELNLLRLRKSYDSTLSLINEKKKLASISSELCDILYEKVSEAHNQKDRHILIEAKRDIYNNRFLALQKCDAIRRYSNSVETTLLADYVDSYKKINFLGQKTARSFNSELKIVRKKLNELSKNDTVKKGLLLSSYDFFKLAEERYWDYSNSSPDDWDTSIEYGIAKYISRIYTKTSPFSTFTHIGFGQFLNCSKNNGETLYSTSDINNNDIYSEVLLNRYLYKYLYTLLSEIPDFLEYFEVRLNPTINVTNSSIHYFTNKGNTESIQTIRSNPTLLAIYNYLLDKEYKFSDLQKFISANSDTEKRKIQVFIKRLINIGFLDCYISSIQASNPSWHINLKDWLKNIDIGSSLKNEVIELLEYFEVAILRYQSSDSLKREKIVSKIFSKYKEACKKLRATENLETFPDEVDDSSNSKKSFYEYKTATKFTFDTHQMLYEDTYCSVPFKMDREVCEDIVELLDMYIRWLIPYERNIANKEKMTGFFLSNYRKDQKIDLLEFYESFQKRNNKSSNSKPDSKLSQLFYDTFEPIDKDSVSIDYESFTKNIKKKNLYPSGGFNLISSHAAFLQFFKEEDKAFAVINGLLPGFGKMFSRFIANNDTFINSIREENKACMEGTMWAEDMDSSFFNANIHPPLMPYEITFPGSQNLLSKEKRIFLHDVGVEYDDKRNGLNLFHKKTKKKVYVFDLCFQNQSLRSDLYQFLDKFTLIQYVSSNALFMQEMSILQRKLKEQRKNKNFRILKIPRVDIDNKIIIQRKSWFIPKELLPVKESHESQSSYFIRVNEWRIKNKLPDELFIKIVYPQERSDLDEEILKELGRDDYKPQYISFDNPFFVEIFSSACRKIPRTLKLTEMLPNSSQLLQFGQGKRVTEFIVQWNSKNNL